MLRRTYALVDLEKIADNIRELKRCAGTGVMAVVKADAYGHGMVPVAKKALQCGVTSFAVATPDEAVGLRKAVPEGMILVLSPVEREAYPALIAGEISLCAFEAWHLKEIARAAAAAGKRARVHLKLDTGMGRVGLRTDGEMAEVLEVLRKYPETLDFEGLFTHFATADAADLSFARIQLSRFCHWREMVLAAGFSPVCHASNSAATMALGAAHFDLCRMGISMYGYMPSGEMEPGLAKLSPALSLWSYVSHVKTIAPGETVSYGRTFTAGRETRIATVPIGYADGYRRALSGQGEAVLAGKKVRVAGRVCMDQIMLDVTGLEVKPGNPVLLLGEQNGLSVTADDWAEKCGTISYEILTGLTARIPRVYVHEE